MKKKLDEKTIRRGRTTLRRVLRRMRKDDQGGYADVRGGKFAGVACFVTSGLPQATPAELDDLFALAGVVPEAIEVLGDCGGCVYGNATGGDLGWSEPCCSCSRPQMKNFVPLAAVTRASLALTADQARYLENAKAREWWATGIVTAAQFSKEWAKQIDACHKVENEMVRRCMVGAYGRRLTNKGLAALQHHRRRRRTG